MFISEVMGETLNVPTIFVYKETHSLPQIHFYFQFDNALRNMFNNVICTYTYSLARKGGRVEKKLIMFRRRFRGSPVTSSFSMASSSSVFSSVRISVTGQIRRSNWLLQVTSLRAQCIIV